MYPGVLKSYFKFFVKTRIVLPLRLLFLFFLKVPANREGWENRLLIINLQALGDLVLFTSVLKHYKRRFPEKRIYLLIKSGTGIEPFIVPELVDEIITVDYKKFAVHPLYGAALVNRLRRIGFQKVINHDFSAAEIQGKIITVNLGAEETIGYEGLGLELRHPFDIQQKKNIRLVRARINPRYTKLIPAIDRGVGACPETPYSANMPIFSAANFSALLKIARAIPASSFEVFARKYRHVATKEGYRTCPRDPERLPSVILHYIAIYEGATGFHEDEYALTLTPPPGITALARFGLASKKYIILNVNASVAYKRWPVERFKAVAEYVAKRGYSIVLVGVKSERELTEKFRNLCALIPIINVSGETSFSELLTLVANAFLIITNDTSLVHISVALKKPLLAVSAGGVFGMFVDYGYADINRWVYERTPCFCDNWQCSWHIAPGDPAPCIASVSAEKVVRVAGELLGYLERKTAAHEMYPMEPFRPGLLR